jgi:hypothetical protein
MIRFLAEEFKDLRIDGAEAQCRAETLFSAIRCRYKTPDALYISDDSLLEMIEEYIFQAMKTQAISDKQFSQTTSLAS